MLIKESTISLHYPGSRRRSSRRSSSRGSSRSNRDSDSDYISGDLKIVEGDEDDMSDRRSDDGKAERKRKRKRRYVVEHDG